MAPSQRLLSVTAESWAHGDGHEAVVGSPVSAAISMTGVEGAAVIQHGGPKVPLQNEVEYQLFEVLNSHCRPEAEVASLTSDTSCAAICRLWPTTCELALGGARRLSGSATRDVNAIVAEIASPRPTREYVPPRIEGRK